MNNKQFNPFGEPNWNKKENIKQFRKCTYHNKYSCIETRGYTYYKSKTICLIAFKKLDYKGGFKTND